jgi:hypothetical protein
VVVALLNEIINHRPRGLQVPKRVCRLAPKNRRIRDS